MCLSAQLRYPFCVSSKFIFTLFILNNIYTFRVYQVLAEEPVKSSEEQPTGVLFVMHHGAGYTGLTWSCMVKKMRSIAKKPFAILCFDCRGHGATSTDDELNLSLATLTDDLSTLIKTVYGKTPSYEIILVGHR